MKYWISLLLLLFLSPVSTFSWSTEEIFNLGRFGKVTLYSESPHPSQVVLFVSGDGGWNLGVIDMARALASLGALVVGIDITHYLGELEKASEKCYYPAADFETLSKFVQKRLDFPNYVTPVLVGYSSGATLVYGTLVQAPPTTFRGALSLGFCPDLPLTKPLCRGSGLEWKPGLQEKGYSLLPASTLEVKWIAFQGTIDQVCNPSQTEQFVQQVQNGELIILPQVGHGFSVQKNWMPQFKEAFLRLVATPGTAAPALSETTLQDLPLVEVPAVEEATDTLAVQITGDGGYGVTDRGLSAALAEQGIPVVCLNSLNYFWKPRTPEIAARDLERVLRHYLAGWKKQKVILIGYSMGADVLPFMVNRLSEEMKTTIQLIVFLGLSKTASFEFHLTDWLKSSSNGMEVLPEVKKLGGKKILCFYGSDDPDALCKSLDQDFVKPIELTGGHRIGKNFMSIADTIIKEVDKR